MCSVVLLQLSLSNETCPIGWTLSNLDTLGTEEVSKLLVRCPDFNEMSTNCLGQQNVVSRYLTCSHFRAS